MSEPKTLSAGKPIDQGELLDAIMDAPDAFADEEFDAGWGSASTNSRKRRGRRR